MAGYVIAEIDVDDLDAYAPYIEGATASVAATGGRYIVRGGPCHVLEGEAPRSRVVVIEFADVDAALAWYHSDAYQAVAPVRQASARSRVFVVDGYDAPR